ncbi:MAG: VCBS repeat-containing protein, partial [Shimia sp.]
NHRIGERDIAGGVRACPGRAPEMILADAGWTRVLGITWDGEEFATRDLGPHRGRESFAAALERC